MISFIQRFTFCLLLLISSSFNATNVNNTIIYVAEEESTQELPLTIDTNTDKKSFLTTLQEKYNFLVAKASGILQKVKNSVALSAHEIENILLPVTIGLLLIFYANPEQVIENIKTWSPTGTFFTIVQQYIRYFLVTTAHELGHALAHYSFYQTQAPIYLGGSIKAKDECLLEITPHIAISGLHPSTGATEVKDPRLYDQKTLRANLQALNAHFIKEYPGKNLAELESLAEYQEAKHEACYKKDLTTKIITTVIFISGVISGLIANGILKVATGESITTIDYFDIKQLLNLIPLENNDGGVIFSTLFNSKSPLIREDALLIKMLTLTAKSLSSIGINSLDIRKIINLDKIELVKLGQKLLYTVGLTTVNYNTLGMGHLNLSVAAAAA